MHRINIIDNFISDEDIKTLIFEIDNPSETLSYPKHYQGRNGGTALPYNKITVSLLKKYGKKCNSIQQTLNGFLAPIYVTKGFASKWTTGKGAPIPHIDAQELEPFIEWSSIIYLNDDFEGGSIFFPNQKFEYKPKRGSAIFFPSAGTEYMHGINTIKSGIRYTFLFMHSSQRVFADPDILDKNDSK